MSESHYTSTIQLSTTKLIHGSHSVISCVFFSLLV